MRHLQRAVALSAMAVSIVCCRSSEGRATLSSSPLAPERVQVYRDFLSEFAGTHFSYLSDTTFALTLSEVGPGSTCLKGIPHARDRAGEDLQACGGCGASRDCPHEGRCFGSAAKCAEGKFSERRG